jgi:hypothetical protein
MPLQSEDKAMPDDVNHAKHELREARQQQREKAAAFWQNTVNHGRILREQTQDQTQQRAPNRINDGRSREDD